MNTNIPIVLFAYKRYKNLSNLIKIVEIHKTKNVFIFCDGNKSHIDFEDCKKTQAVALDASSKYNFKVIIRHNNLGLNQNILSGVDYVLSIHECALFLEDDILPNNNFINFIYKKEKEFRNIPNIFSISGFHSYDPSIIDYELFYTPRFFCWGWLTWSCKWKTIKDNVLNMESSYDHYWQIPCDIGDDLIYAHRAYKLRRKSLTWDRIVAYNTRKLNFIHLCPKQVVITNNGFDGDGENCNKNSLECKIFENLDLNQNNKTIDLINSNKIFLLPYSNRNIFFKNKINIFKKYKYFFSYMFKQYFKFIKQN